MCTLKKSVQHWRSGQAIVKALNKCDAGIRVTQVLLFGFHRANTKEN